MDNLSYFITSFPQGLQKLFLSIDNSIKPSINEIRLRKNKLIIIYVISTPYFIEIDGTLVKMPTMDSVICPDYDFEYVCDRLCSHSYHTNMPSLVNGYITCENGSRVGVASTGVSKNGEISSIRDITSLNIRISHEYIGCSKKIASVIYKDKLPSIIVAGKVASGKTTFLRDYARCVSGGFNGKYKKVSIIDERREIVSCFDVGINTDYLYGFSKAKGIEIATRTLSPDLIICDEIGSFDELNAIKYSFSSGVKFAVSVHIGNRNDIVNNEILNGLIDTGQFDYIVILNSFTDDFEIVDLRDDGLEIFRNDNDNFSFFLPWIDDN